MMQVEKSERKQSLLSLITKGFIRIGILIALLGVFGGALQSIEAQTEEQSPSSLSETADSADENEVSADRSSSQDESSELPSAEQVLRDAKAFKSSIKTDICNKMNASAERIKSSARDEEIAETLDTLNAFIQKKYDEASGGSLYNDLIPKIITDLQSKQSEWEEKIKSTSVSEDRKKAYERYAKTLKEKIDALERMKRDEIDVLLGYLEELQQESRGWKEFYADVHEDIPIADLGPDLYGMILSKMNGCPRPAKAKAKYDFPGGENQLTLKIGEIVTVKADGQSDWYWATNEQGQEGWVPSSYVDILKQ